MTAPPFDSSISVVLPAYNEEDCIEKAVRDTLDFLPTCFDDFEIVVVDDGSKDRTAEIVTGIAAEDARVVLVRHEGNRGYGRAIGSGFDRASKELVFFTDADNQFDIRELKEVVPHLFETGADVVFGFRVYRYDSVLRCVLSWTYNRIVRVLFSVKVRDVDCSFKLFRREVIEAMTIECNDFFVDTELVARTSAMGFKSVEKGVRHYPRTAGRTTVRAGHIPRTLLTVAKMWWRIRIKGGGKRRRQTPDVAAEARAVDTP